MNREAELRDIDRRIAILDRRLGWRATEVMTSHERRQLLDARAALRTARNHLADRLAGSNAAGITERRAGR
jgi:hypothetical protein